MAASRSAPLLPGQRSASHPQRAVTLGVMGGGQLGRMFVHAAQALGFRTAVLDADPTSPAGRVAHVHIQTPYLDADGLALLVDEADAVTTEFENVPADALRQLATRRPVGPGGDAVAVCQDRAAEKAHFRASGVPCAPFAVIDSEADLAAVADDLLPGILKTARLGYDGKGQVRVTDRAALEAAWSELGRVTCVLEKRLALAAEVSVIVARGAEGQVVQLPLQQNLHRDGILAVTTVPAARPPRPLPAPNASLPAWTTWACCASSSSCWPTVRRSTAPWWPTRWRRVRTTPATTASTPATSRSSSCRCAAWPACRW